MKRIELEGKLGESKRVYGLDRVRTRRADTSETTIMMAVMAMKWGGIFRSFGSKSLVTARLTPCGPFSGNTNIIGFFACPAF